jgi:hypothetical protein
MEIDLFKEELRIIRVNPIIYCSWNIHVAYQRCQIISKSVNRGGIGRSGYFGSHRVIVDIAFPFSCPIYKGRPGISKLCRDMQV